MVRLKYWRIKKGLTQLQLAAMLGTSAGYIYEIEIGKKVPSLKVLIKISNVLDVCIKDLIICDCKKCKKKTLE